MTVVMSHDSDHQMTSGPSLPSLIQPTSSSQMAVNRIMGTSALKPEANDRQHQPFISPGSQTAETASTLRVISQGRIYTLEIHQQPQRARMCGFGDKDRRPITPPPCVRLRVFDAITQQQLEVGEIDTSYFILTVDLWSAEGLKEVNLVRHSATSPSISAATATSYPPSTDGVAPGFTHIASLPGGPLYPGFNATQASYNSTPAAYGMPRQNELSRHMEIAQQASREEAIRIQNEQQHLQSANQYPPQSKHARPESHVMHPSTQAFLDGGPGGSAGLHAHGHNTSPYHHQPSSNQQGGSYPQQSLVPAPQQSPMNIVDPRSQPGGMFTRNLIGSLAVGAFKLTYPENDLGIWFILQDLSVRTEGTFRLKLNFVDVGASTGGMNNSSTDPNTLQALQTGRLNSSSAPVLASTFTDVFQVFSAKRFPGVKESTDLSKAFAKQGIKLPIRKEGPSNGRGGERRDWDEDV